MPGGGGFRIMRPGPKVQVLGQFYKRDVKRSVSLIL